MPLYRAVKRVLMQAIEDGRLAPGAALANEATLSSHLGVSIGTLRQAVGELVSEHLLVRRQGRGTFVARHSAERFLFQFFHVERGDGRREAPPSNCSASSAAGSTTRLPRHWADALAKRRGCSTTACCCRAARWCTTALRCQPCCSVA